MVAMGYGAEDVAFSADEQDRLALLQPREDLEELPEAPVELHDDDRLR